MTTKIKLLFVILIYVTSSCNNCDKYIYLTAKDISILLDDKSSKDFNTDCGDCDEALLTVNLKDSLENYNSEFNILIGSGTYNKYFKELKGITYEKNSINSLTQRVMLENLERFDSIVTRIDEDKIHISYFHIVYGCTTFIPSLTETNDSVIIRRVTSLAPSISCYKGEVKVSGMSTMCVEGLKSEIIIPLKRLKNKLPVFKSAHGELYQLSLESDTTIVNYYN
ncbi:MAG: hypothetical protein KF732_09140 [Flavobacteriales bacterium]|nr:hypothetical protein [Flavobacteriales bacterium]MBX2960107.1 hypothetical protein [Flavobacteriales bacterium]